MSRYNARRPSAVRDTLPIVVVVCDDSKSAPNYFAELQQTLRKFCTIRVVAVPKDDSTVMDVAILKRSDLTDGGADATVWALIDLEMRPDSTERAHALRERAVRDDIRLVLSQPCFEVWILLHFKATGQHFLNCKAVIRELRKCWKGAFETVFPDKKAQADYRKLGHFVEPAIRHARESLSRQNQSWTEVWKVVHHALSTHS